MQTTFFRLLQADDKAAALADAIDAAREYGESNPVAFAVDPASFSQVPGSPFAYWVSERIRRLFTHLPPFESDARRVRVGLQTSDDFRFVRAWWEVAPGKILDAGNDRVWKSDIPGFQEWCRQRPFQEHGWLIDAPDPNI